MEETLVQSGRSDPLAEENFRQICGQVEAEMKRLPIPGVVVGVLHEDRELISGFGVTSVEHPLAVTPGTLFQVGSITKTFVATACIRLVELGRLDLDLPVRFYLPDLRLEDEGVAAQVTVRHLLTHTGGWVGDYFDDLGPGDDALERMVARLVELPQLTPLGQVWSYSNSGFYIAGRVIEVVTGKSFEAAMGELLFEPLGLERTFFFAEDVITHRFAVGHEVVDRQPRVARPWAIGRAAHPVGGITCSMGDLFRYARFHVGAGTAAGGKRLLSPESLAWMQTPMFPSTGITMMGLGWNVITVADTKLIGHAGGTNGQVALLRIVPSRKFAAAVFTNSDEGSTLTYPIVNLATRLYLGLSLPEAAPLDLPEESLLPYTGVYEAPADRLELSLQEGGLILKLTPKGGFPTPDSPPSQAPPPMRMALYGEDRVIVLDEPMKDSRGEFLRDEEGRIVWLRLGGRIHARRESAGS